MNQHARIRLLICSIFFACVCYINSSQAALIKNNPQAASFTDRLYQHLDHLNRRANTRNQPVTIILESDAMASTTRALLKSAGAEMRYNFGRRHEISIPATRFLSLLDRLPPSVHARLPYPHEEVATTSQGVGITGAADMQVLGSAGAGVKIGIIDMGFTNYTGAQSTGDLPGSLTITDYTGSGTGGTNHGTQVAEIVYDMAPGADFYLAKIASSTQLQQAVDDMVAAGVSVINHSVGWFGAAFYDGTGVLCDIANTAEVNGIQWVNAMGNSRTKHYLGRFLDTDGDLRHEFAAAQNSNGISLTAGSPVTLVLNWDAYPATDIDYNLYLYDGDPDAGGTLVASSTQRQDGVGVGDEPYEAISYTPAITATHYIVVKKDAATTADIPLSLFSLGPGLAVKTTSSSIVQPADCSAVLGVGATDLTDAAEWFSSEGPTTDGRIKPDVSAPNRVVTSLSSSFAGTSAASPHVAGAIALLLSQTPSLSTTQLRNIIMNDSFDVASAGFDYRTGYGRMSLDADLDSFNHDDDNCPLVSNIDQADLDGDTLGDVCDTDIDGDGLLNTDETARGTDPYNADTDTDGLNDGDEVKLYLSNPLLLDTDLDGLGDGDEVLIYSTDPNASNTGDLAPRGAPDNIFNIADLLLLFRLTETLDSATTYEQIAGDINRDGFIDIRDVLQLRRDLGF